MCHVRRKSPNIYTSGNYFWGTVCGLFLNAGKTDSHTSTKVYSVKKNGRIIKSYFKAVDYACGTDRTSQCIKSKSPAGTKSCPAMSKI